MVGYTDQGDPIYATNTEDKIDFLRSILVEKKPVPSKPEVQQNRPMPTEVDIRAGQNPGLAEPASNMRQNHYVRSWEDEEFAQKNWNDGIPIRRTRPFRPITENMIRNAAFKASAKSAPGKDGITYRIIQEGWNAFGSQYLVPLVQDCAKVGYHPHIWREQIGLVIPKAGKGDYTSGKAY